MTTFEILISEKKVQLLPTIIKQFIKELQNKPIIAITADLYPLSEKIMDNLNIKQQLYIIHLRKIIYYKIKCYKRKLN